MGAVYYVAVWCGDACVAVTAGTVRQGLVGTGVVRRDAVRHGRYGGHTIRQVEARRGDARQARWVAAEGMVRHDDGRWGTFR